jgi:hypothetical protein
VVTQTRAPTSDVSATGTWTGTAGTRYTLVDDYPDSAGTDVLTHGTTAGDIRFGFSTFTVPAAATSPSFLVRLTARKNGGGASHVRVRLYFNGGTTADSSLISPTNGSYGTHTANWGTGNPSSGTTWTINELNGVGTHGIAGFGFVSTDASPTITISAVEAEVTYTVTELTGTFSATLADDESTAQGVVNNRGTISSILEGVTSSASLTVGGFFGTFASTLGGVTANFVGTTPVKGFHSFLFLEAGGAGHLPGLFGTISSTLAGVTSDASLVVNNRGTFTPTLANVTANFNGTGIAAAGYKSFLWIEGGGAHHAPTVPTGTISVTLGNVTSAATLVVNNRGTFTPTLASLTASFTGFNGNSLGGFRSLLGLEGGGFASTPASPFRLQPYDDGLPGAWYADPGYGSYYAYNPDGIRVQNRDQAGNDASGEIAETLDNVTAAFSGAVIQDATGTIAVTLSNIVPALSGVVGFPSGNIASTVGLPLVMDISGKVTVAGEFAPTLSTITSAFTVIVNNRGTIAPTLVGITSDFTGRVSEHVTGTFGATLEGALGADFFTYRNRHISIGINRLSI